MVVISLTVYAFTTKTDFTILGGLFFILGFVLIGAVILGIFFRSKIYQIILASLILVFYGLYLIYDTQLIVGNQKYSLSYDDYIIGALSLYIDIV